MKDDDIIQEAKDRFKRCEEWESDARKNYEADIKFANADSDNGWQWPLEIRAQREIDQRPSLTINKARQHNLQIINDAKQNKPSVKISPTGEGATYDAAQIYEGIVRHIEYISNAEVAYDTATTSQVQGGIGYWRIVTDYADDDSFDQEIFIRRVKDPLTIYLDPDIQEADGSDARFAFAFEDMSKDAFEAAYPKLKDKIRTVALGNADNWINKEHVRIAEYYRVVERADRLITVPGVNGQEIIRASEKPKEIVDALMASEGAKSRPIITRTIEWFKIAADEIIDRKPWAGVYIPIARVVGEEVVVEGKLDRKGHTRAMKDSQRMYNYWSSSAVEFVALQTKSPYITTLEAIEGLETYWNSANTANHAYLPYNGKDEQGNPVPAPSRLAPPAMSQAYLEGMRVASDEIQAVSGQFEAEMGMPGNEKSGAAINARQRQGDRATYHYIDNLGIAIRFTGKILIDLIPKIYDTKRVVRIIGEDGSENNVTIDPQAPQAYQEEQQQDDQIKSVFNPNVGKYNIIADVGPGYATKRQEAFNAFQQIASANPDLMSIIGDLMFKSADFPLAEELAERLKRMVPAQALGTAPPPELQQAQEQLQNMQKLLEQLTTELSAAKQQNLNQEGKINVETYNAETRRLRETMVTPKDMAQMAHDAVLAAHKTSAAMQQQANTESQNSTASHTQAD